MDQPQSNKDNADSPYIHVELRNLEFLAAGKSAVVYGIDDERVLKAYYGDEEDDIDVERRAFARLGLHPNIVRLIGTTCDRYIVLERGEPLRAVLQRAPVNQISLREKLCSLKDAAEGIHHMHQNGIFHADIGCNNMILIENRVKVIDFEGCSIDGENPTSGYEWFSSRDPYVKRCAKTDIFAYGCAVYEFMTGQRPYQELEKYDNRTQLVRKLYAENEFPSVTRLPLGPVMQGCWHGAFDSMSNVIDALNATELPPTERNESMHKLVSGFVFMKMLLSRLWGRIRIAWCNFLIPWSC